VGERILPLKQKLEWRGSKQKRKKKAQQQQVCKGEKGGIGKKDEKKYSDTP
jgi:hypothetical protein